MVLVSVLGLVLRSGLFRSVVQVYLGIFGAVILCLEMETGYFNKHQEFKVCDVPVFDAHPQHIHTPTRTDATMQRCEAKLLDLKISTSPSI